MEYEKLIEKAKLNKANIVVYVNAEYTGAGNHGNIIEFSPKEFTKKKYSIVSKLKDEYLNVPGEFNTFDFTALDSKTKNWTKTEKKFVADKLFPAIYEKGIPNTLLDMDIYLKVY